MVECGILYRNYKINGFGEERRALFVPFKLKEMFIHKNHDIPSAGHFGWRKTL